MGWALVAACVILAGTALGASPDCTLTVGLTQNATAITVVPEHPLLTKAGDACACTTTKASSAGRRLAAAGCGSIVLTPATYSVEYSLNDSATTMVGTFPDGDATAPAPSISIADTLDGLPKGVYCIAVTVTLQSKTATVTSNAAKFPAADTGASNRVCINTNQSAAAGPAPVLVGTTLAPTSVNTTALGGGAPGSGAPVKYHCLKQYNVGGKIIANTSVPASDTAAADCAQACNDVGTPCAAFGLSGATCYLVGLVDTTTSAADPSVDAYCVKSLDTWLAVGSAGGATPPGFYCLKGYDVQGGAAGNNANLPLGSVASCAGGCSGAPTCQVFVQSDKCYLKTLDGPYGTTGPSAGVSLACFNGQESWTQFGAVLDYILPAENTVYDAGLNGTVGGALGGAALGGAANGGPSNYYCIQQWAVNSSAIKQLEVVQGQGGVMACAGACDADPTCAGHSTSIDGVCTLLTALDASVGEVNPQVNMLCLRSAADWNKLAAPDSSGFRCLKDYDIQGDGVGYPVSYVTAVGGAEAPNYCKGSCKAEPACQYVVTALGNCYLKANMLSGLYGTTGFNSSVTATCISGASNWLAFAQQVTASVQSSGVGQATGLQGNQVIDTSLPSLGTSFNAALPSGRARGAGSTVAALTGVAMLLGVLWIP